MRNPTILCLQLFLGLELCCWWCFGLLRVSSSQGCPVLGTGLDANSKAYLAPVVFQGRLLAKSKTAASVLRATFRVQKVLKMDDGAVDKSVLREKNDVVVEFFLEDSDSTPGKARRKPGKLPCRGASLREKDLVSEQRYIVFVALKRPPNFLAAAVPEPFSKRKAISKILCPKCAKPPTARELGDVRVELKKKLRLKCKLSGNPPPRIAWYKNGVKLKPTDRLKLRTKRRYSRLVIRRVNKQDGGQYECRATNVIGNSSSIARVTVVPPEEKRPPPLPPPTSDSTLWPLQGLPCPLTSYCLNGGTCSLYETVGEYVCECAEGYRGRRCESKAISTLSSPAPVDAPQAPHDLDATTRMLQRYWGK